MGLAIDPLRVSARLELIFSFVGSGEVHVVAMWMCGVRVWPGLAVNVSGDRMAPYLGWCSGQDPIIPCSKVLDIAWEIPCPIYRSTHGTSPAAPSPSEGLKGSGRGFPAGPVYYADFRPQPEHRHSRPVRGPRSFRLVATSRPKPDRMLERCPAPLGKRSVGCGRLSK
jgi:hypothetical protein